MAQPELIKDIEARVKKSGDIMTGLLSAHGGISLNASTKQETPEYILGIKSFANGGNIIWQSISSVQVGKANALTVSAGSSTTPVYFSGGQPVACSYFLGANIYAYSGTLASNGWKTMHGKADSPVISIAYNNGAAAWNSGTYSSSMVFGCQDTRGLLDLAYNQPIVTFGGTWYDGATDDNPAWYFKLKGTSGQTYTFPTSSKTLCATDGSNASGTWGININGNADSSKLTDALRVFSTTGEPNNAYSYKLIWTTTPSGWKNHRIVLGMSSRHTGNGIICISCGVDNGTVSASTVYGQIVYYGNNNNATASTGGVFNKDMLQLYYNASTNRLFLFLRYYDYNGVQINIIDAYTSGGTKVSLSEFTDGVYVSSIDSATYGSLVCQTQKGWIEGDLVTGAVWNDYAEYRKAESIEPGRVVVESADGEMKLSTERLQPGAEIISDTFGFAIGETDEYKTPIAATGRVLAYPNEDRYSYPLGCAVCSGPNGTVSQMTREEIREYPERIIGTVSEIPEYKTWGTGNVEVNGRIWIRVK